MIRSVTNYECGPSVATVGALLGEPARASILCTLLDGKTRTATELSYIAGVSASTTSVHLAKLVDGRLLVVERQGRYRYYRLAGGKIARMLETVLAVSDARLTPTLMGAREFGLREARMCYDHIAGSLGVALTGALIERKDLVIVDENIELTGTGERFFDSLGIDLEATRKRRRKFASYCIDWSEQRPHLSGALGEALAAHCFRLKWLRRLPNSRAVCVTAKGKQELKSKFSLDWE